MTYIIIIMIIVIYIVYVSEYGDHVHVYTYVLLNVDPFLYLYFYLGKCFLQLLGCSISKTYRYFLQLDALMDELYHLILFAVFCLAGHSR